MSFYNYSNDNDTPTKQDLLMKCHLWNPNTNKWIGCNETAIQHRTLYWDVEYRHCSRCKLSTTLVVNTGDRKYGPMVVRVEKHVDTSIEDYDFKRAADRKYRPRTKRKGRFIG